MKRVLKIEKDQDSDSECELSVPPEKKDKFERAKARETELLTKEATKVGLGGLSVEEMVVGAMYTRKFEGMPDPISEVIFTACYCDFYDYEKGK